MKIVSDHGFPRGSMPDDDPFAMFKNEREYVAKSGQNKTTVAAMDWAAGEIDRLRGLAFKYLQEVGVQARRAGNAADLVKMLDLHVDGVRHYLHLQIGKPLSKDLISAPEIALENLHREMKAALTDSSQLGKSQ
jgi:hypothetical protein